MGASLTPGYTFETSEAPTPAKLHALIESARMTGLVLANCYTDNDRQVHIVQLTDPASPTDGMFKVDSAGELVVYGKSQWLKLEGVEFFVNWSGGTMNKGAPAYVDHLGTKLITDVGASTYWRFIGVCGETISSGVSGMVIHKGTAQMYFDNTGGPTWTEGDSIVLSMAVGITLGNFADVSFTDQTAIAILCEPIDADEIGLFWVRIRT